MDGLGKGYLVGSFDLFNVGHLALINEAASLCEALLVGVVADAVVEAETGAVPYVPLTERLQIVRSIRGVAEAFVSPSQLEVAYESRGFAKIFFGNAKPVPADAELFACELGLVIVQLQTTRDTDSELVRRALHAHRAAA